MEINKKLITGIFFILVAAVFAYGIVRDGAQSHMIAGFVLCLLIGIGFMRNSRRP
jgi:hypothetical protein